jgi:hypothetical protein
MTITTDMAELQEYANQLYPPVVQGLLSWYMIECRRDGDEQSYTDLLAAVRRHGEEAGLKSSGPKLVAKLNQVRNILAHFEKLREERDGDWDLDYDLLSQLHGVLG